MLWSLDVIYIVCGRAKVFKLYQVQDLVEASKTFDNLDSILDKDVANDTVKAAGSHSRNLRRVRQGLDLIRALFEQFVSTKYAHMPFHYFFTSFVFASFAFLVGWICHLMGFLYLFFSDYSLKEAASRAYAQVFAPYHSWAVRTAVSAGMYTLPTREELLIKLKETGELLV